MELFEDIFDDLDYGIDDVDLTDTEMTAMESILGIEGIYDFSDKGDANEAALATIGAVAAAGYAGWRAGTHIGNKIVGKGTDRGLRREKSKLGGLTDKEYAELKQCLNTIRPKCKSYAESLIDESYVSDKSVSKKSDYFSWDKDESSTVIKENRYVTMVHFNVGAFRRSEARIDAIAEHIIDKANKLIGRGNCRATINDKGDIVLRYVSPSSDEANESASYDEILNMCAEPAVESSICEEDISAYDDYESGDFDIFEDLF